MPVRFGSILHLNNSGSEATLDANNLRGTAIQIDSFDSASLATIGSGLTTAPGKRRLGIMVATTGSLTAPPRYYLYMQTGSGDTNLSGSEWTTLTNWREIVVQSSTGNIGTTNALFNDITSSGNISSSGTIFADNITFDGPRGVDSNTILFSGLTQLSSSKVAGLQWEFPNDDFFIYAHQSSSDRTKMVFESRDNLTDEFVFWFNAPGAQANSASNAFPLSMTGERFVVNHIYDRRTTYHRDGDGVGNLPANNVDFFLLKSGSTTVSVNNSLIHGDVSAGKTTLNDIVFVDGNLTASGDISSSGKISGGDDLVIKDATRTIQLDINNGSNEPEIKASGATLQINKSNGTDTNFDNGTLYIDASGNSVGIGETSPDEKLHLKNGNFRIETGDESQQSIRFTELDVERARIEFDSLDANKDLSIQTTNAAGALLDRLVVKHSQDDTQIGIGVSTPTKALQVQGDISASAIISAGTFQSVGKLIGLSDGTNVTLGNANTPTIIQGNITASGDISSSGTIRANELEINNTDAVSRIGTTLRVGVGADWTQINIGKSGAPKNILLTGPVTASGDISSSGIITAGGISSSNATLTGDLDVDGTTNLDVVDIDGAVDMASTLTLNNNTTTAGNISSPFFSSGFAGSGFQITSGSDGKTSFTIDNLTVRDKMSVFELLIHQVRATNGSLFVSNTAKITSASLSSVANHYSMSFDTGSGYGHSFQVGDLIRAQRFVPSTNGSGSQVFKSDLHIITLNGTGSVVGVLTASAEEQNPLSKSAPQPGYEYVRIGNLHAASASRQGSIYLTSDDENAPFIDVVDGLTAHSQFNSSGTTKVRMGKLDGITTANSDFGTLSGFGLYASGSAFLEGGINATEGKIGSFTINSGSISSSNDNLKLFGTGVISGSNVHFNGGTIGGFEIGSDIISSSNGTLILKNNGQITGSAVSMSGTMTATSGKIAGWDIDGNILKNGTNIQLDGGNKRISINDSTFGNDGLQMEHVTNGAKFHVGDGANKFIKFDGTDVDIKTEKATISGSNVNILTPNFFLGSATNNISSSNNDLSITTKDLTASGSSVRIEAPSTFLGQKGTSFISASDSKIEISASDFHLKGGRITASNVDLSGKITATSGEFSGDVVATSLQATTGSIGGFRLDNSTITASDSFKLDSNTETLQLGNVVDFAKNGSDKGMFVSSSGQFFVGKEDGDFIHFDGTDLNIKSDNLNITASDIDMTTDSFELNTQDLDISSTGKSISLGEGKIKLLGATNPLIDIGSSNAIRLFAGSDDNFIKLSTGVSSKTNLPHYSNTSKTGIIFGITGGGVTKFGMTNDANNHFQFDDNGIQIKATNATLSGSNVNILTPSFFFGSSTNNISSSADDLSITTKNLTASGSSVEVLTPNFFFGTATNNISSSDDDLSITTKNLTASGSSVNIITPNFFLGSATNNISSSNDDLSITTKNLTASGSSVSISSPSVFLGQKSTNFISASSGTIEISSSTFAVKGGAVTASAGKIGGFKISDDKLSSTNDDIILDSTNNSITIGVASTVNKVILNPTDGLFVGASSRNDSTPFQVSATGRMTASTALIKGASNVLCDANSTGSFGKLSGSVQHTTLGSGSIELNTFTSDTTIYEAINTIDNILNKLAPAKPPNLSDSFMSLDFNTTITTFTGRGTSGAQTESITVNANPTFTVYSGSTENAFFFDGDNGELTASRAVNDGAFTNIATASITTGDDKNTYQTNLVILDDLDFHLGTAGSEGFWRALKAQVKEVSVSAGTDRYFVKLKHSITGEVSKSYYVDDSDGNPSIITNTDMSYATESNGVHFQSGIPYLGQNNTITASYDVQISSTANFLNSSGRIGSARINLITNTVNKDITTAWSTGTTHNVTSSLTIGNSKFKSGTDTVDFKKFNSQNTSGEDVASQVVTKNFNIDSKQEDETKPSNGVQTTFRSGSGVGRFPSFALGEDASAATFGASFNTTASLTTDNHFELQFANEYFHWPAAVNYSNFIPSGPDYSSITGDDESLVTGLRWATFNLGNITDKLNVTINLQDCNGFDNNTEAPLESSDGFEMYLKVMDGLANVTKWIDCNNSHDSVSNPGDLGGADGVAGVSAFSNGGSTNTANKEYTRTITFGSIPRTGTVYVRVGWKNTGGTDPTDTGGGTTGTRMFKYLYIT